MMALQPGLLRPCSSFLCSPLIRSPLLCVPLIWVPLLCALLLCATAGGARSAFEWTHPSPRGWTVGVDEARWPISSPADRRRSRATEQESSRRFRAALHHGRPWDWPDLEAVAVTGGLGARHWFLCLATSQLRALDYHETRWVVGAEVEVSRRQWIGFTCSALDLTTGMERRMGQDLSLGWRQVGEEWLFELIVLSAWRSRAAAELGVPRRLIAGLTHGKGPIVTEFQWRESAVDASFRCGTAIHTGRRFTLRAALATAEPRLRWGLGLRLDRWQLDAAWLLHGELPWTQVIGLTWGAAP